MIYTEYNGVGGTRYLTDRIGGGVLIFDTALVDDSELIEAVSLHLGIDLWSIDHKTTNKEAFLLGMLLAYRGENQKMLASRGVPESIIRRYGEEIIEMTKADAGNDDKL